MYKLNVTVIQNFYFIKLCFYGNGGLIEFTGK